MTHPELHATLLAKGPYGRGAAPYTLLQVGGPDAAEFLHRLCSGDVEGVAEGQVVPATFMDGKGKLRATVLIMRSGETFWLETHTEQVEALLALLERYHFSEKLTIQKLDLGPCAELIAGGDDGVAECTIHQDEAGLNGIELHIVRRGVAFTRAYGVANKPAGAAMSADLAEALRMLAGFVRVGVETEPSTLALEADLGDHCSTTKGCYTGQEIVARIHTYGHVNRKLCLLRLPIGESITEPVALHEVEDDIPVGRVMHAVPVADAGVRVGLGYLPKDFQAGGTRLTLAGEGDVEVLA